MYGNKMSVQGKIAKIMMSKAKITILSSPISVFHIIIICTQLAK